MTMLLQLLGRHSVSLRVEQGQKLIIGRSPACDLCINDTLVSRQHCEVKGEADHLLLLDLGSRNGTEVNGERLHGSTVARAGDQVRIGRASLLVESTSQRASWLAERARADEGSPDVTAAQREAALPSLPGYELMERLADGQHSVVLRAREEKSNAPVAVKVLKPGSSREMIDRFLRSAEKLWKLDHPNIIKIVDVRDSGRYRFYAMELLDGRTLATLLKDGPVGVRQAMAIGVQIARALRLVHAEGLVHRDVSPDNIVVRSGGIAKLVGFSFLKDLAEDGGAITQLGDLVGDEAYSSPEQLRDPRRVDHRSDLYSLGAVLFHAVTGEPPYGGEGLERLRRVLGGGKPEDSLPEDVVLPPTVSGFLDSIVRQLLAREPNDRFQTAKEVEIALDHALLTSCKPDPAPAVATKVPALANRRITATQAVVNPVASSHTFGGGFSGLELLEIVQFLELHGKSGRLRVDAVGGQGELRLDDGVIRSAWTTDDVYGKEAVRALLGSPEGTFTFDGNDDALAASGVSPADAGISIRPSAIALDLMRARDEEISRT